MTAPHAVGANRQLMALLVLRMRMLRSAHMRVGVVGCILLPAAMALVAFVGLRSTPDEQQLTLVLATPTFYVGFVVLTVLAPLFSGGGYELFPSGQLVAFPMRAATTFRGTLALAPINLAWILNVIALFVVTALAVGEPAWIPTSRALCVVAAFVAAATIIGHAIGWLVMGVRHSRRGRLVTNVAGVMILLGGLAVAATGHLLDVLDHSPTAHVLDAACDGYRGGLGGWLAITGLFIGGAVVMIGVGDAVAGWALRRPGDHSDRSSSRPQPRRPPPRASLPALVAIDHASIWRSTPLRRGVLVIIVVPGLVAALAGMSWQSLILVPGLIAAGAGLLFGINAFSLDASGAVWLAALPGWSRPAFLAKSVVFTELAVIAVSSALAGGSVRAPSPASVADVTAAVASALSCALIVVAIGMRSSLRHPHRAALEDARDTPAPPGVMAVQSLRIATVTTLACLVFAGLALSQVWWVPLVGAVPVAGLAVRHWRRTGRAWDDPQVRAHVVQTVTSG